MAGIKAETNSQRVAVSTDLNFSQKMLIKQWLSAVVEESGHRNDFNVIADRERVIVLSADTAAFPTLLDQANLSNSVTLKPGTVKVVNSQGYRDAAMVEIVDIESSLLHALAGKHKKAEASEPPANDDAALPDTLRRRWKQFSPEMQAHITSCLASFHPPRIGLYHDTLPLPRIPVRFPNLDMMMSGSTHNLMDVLASQHTKGQLRDPITGKLIKLHELVPAAEGIEERNLAKPAAWALGG